MSWSKQQLQAIEARGQNLLVAAAAGSGKTSVLVERIIKRILDEHEPVNVDKLLVVTFTSAAAAEMRERIGSALTAALTNANRRRYIERQLLLLNSSSISTIHSFCQSVVRQYFYFLDLDPNFRIANDTEVQLLKSDVLDALFTTYYEQGSEAFLHLVDCYGDERDDSSLVALVLELYEFARSQPWPEHWLTGLTQAFRLSEGVSLDDTPWSLILRDKITLELEQTQQKLRSLASQAVAPENPAGYAAVFTDDAARLDEVIAGAAHSWELTAERLANCTFADLPSAKGTSAEVRKHFQTQRQRCKDKVKDLGKRYFSRPAEVLIEEMRGQLPVVETLVQLVIAFGRDFQQAKQAKGLVDFGDLEHYCLRILLERDAAPGEVKPSPVAVALRQKFAEVMVDEYQDTNGVQETILQLVSRTDQPNRFMVGDVKQSIYRFRLAEPALFMAKYNQYPITEAGGERRIDLAQNFRSRPGILSAVNFLFSQLMTPRAAEMAYGQAEELNPGSSYPPAPGPIAAGPVELHLIDRADGGPEASDDNRDAETDVEESIAVTTPVVQEMSNFEREAWLIARRLEALKTSGCLVFDKDSKTYRPVAWRDIVILLRAVHGKADVMLDVMRQRGIPAYADLGSGYFQATEVQLMMSLLNIIDNPRQDIHLAGVLRSPLVGLSATELTEVRLCREHGDLWSALVAATEGAQSPTGLKQKIQPFVERLSLWRDLARRKGVNDLISQLYRDTGYYDYVGAMPGGLLRQANLRALESRARQYEATNYRGLFRFLRFIDRLRDKGADLAVARTLGESEDVVRIMSIHKSKGLEFPVVILADLGKQINLRDTKATVLCHKELGLGPKVINPDQRLSYPTLARLAIEHKLTLEAKAEELRILYVALTRAREKLILVGSVKDLVAKSTDWCALVGRRRQTLPDPVIAGAKTYLDWLGSAVIRHAGGAVLRDYIGCEELPSAALSGSEADWQITVHRLEDCGPVEQSALAESELLASLRELKPIATGTDTAWVGQVLGWQYASLAAVGKPAKLSVTEIKRRFAAEEANSQSWQKQTALPARPRFIQKEGKLTAAEFGTVMHSVMQHLDLAGDVTPTGLAAQIASLTERDILLPAEAVAVDCQRVHSFLSSSLGQRLCRSSWLKRELAFSRVVPAERFYPELAGAGEGIFVQGIIDLLFWDEDGLVLIDYKTDRVRDGRELIDKYAMQLRLYAEAVQGILQKPVKEIYLYVFSTGEIVAVD